MRIRIGLIELLLLFSANLFAQTNKIDSLNRALYSMPEDSGKVKTMNLLFTALLQKARYDTALVVAENAAKLSEKVGYKKGMAAATINIGVIHSRLGNYEKSLNYYHEGLKISEELNDKWGIAKALINSGNVYVSQGHFPKGLTNYFDALKFYEEMGDKNAISIVQNNIGNIYYYQNNFSEALKHFTLSLKISEKISDSIGIANAYANIGNVYRNQDQLDEALDYYTKGLEMQEAIGDLRGVGTSYNNFGGIYERRGDYKEALKNFFRALEIREKIGDRKGIASTCGYIGVNYNKLKQPAEAKVWLGKSLKLGTELGTPEIISDAHHDLSKACSSLGEHKAAYDHFVLYIAYRDSLINKENTEKTIQQQLQYEYDKKTVADSLKNAETKKLEELQHNQQLAEQKRFMYAGVAGFIIMIIVSAILIIAFRNKKKANKEIREQKALIEEKQREIVDSIKYARRIQRALITNEQFFDKTLKRLRKKN